MKFLSPVNFSPVSNVYHHDKQMTALDHVENSVTANSVGITTLEFPFQEFALEGITPKPIHGPNDARVERGLALCNAPE